MNLHALPALVAALLATSAVIDVVPHSPVGYGVFSLIFWIVLYPVARETWLRSMPAWRHWPGVPAGVVGVTGLEHVRRQPSEPVGWILLVMAAGLGVATYLWFRAYLNRTRTSRA